VASWRRASAWARGLFFRDRLERDLDDELRFHLEKQVEENLRAGMSEAEAHRRARLDLGGLEQIKEEVRDVGSLRFVEETLRDLRHGLRALRLNSGFTAVAVATLALGVGANAAVFTLINGVVLHPFPYRDADRLILLHARMPEADLVPLPLADFYEWRDQSRSFESMGAVYRWTPILTGDGEPEQLFAARVTSDMFPTLGIAPEIGRTFLPEEDGPKGDPVVVLSHTFWMRRFGGSRDAVGRTLTLDGVAHRVIGVMPPRFEVWTADVWAPIGQDSNHQQHLARTLPPLGIYAIGRPRAGVKIDQVRAEVAAIADRLKRAYPETNAKLDGGAVFWREQTASELRPALVILFGAVGLVLLIACANLTSLLLARATARHREFAVRAALGAGRLRLIRQILVENLLLATLGGGAGLLLAQASLGLLTSLFPAESTTAEVRISIDHRVLAFAFAAALAAGALSGLVAGWHATRGAGADWLREGTGRITRGRERGRLTRALLVGEVAVSLALLIGSALLIESFFRVRASSAGFEVDHIASVSFQIPASRYAEPAPAWQFLDGLLQRARSLPGVRAAALTSNVPFGHVWRRSPMTLLDRAEPERLEDAPQFDFALVSDDFFRTLRIPLLQGRTFSPSDGPDSPPVAIVNETARRRLWPDADPIDRMIQIGVPEGLQPMKPPPGFKRTRLRVIGVVGDIKTATLEEATGLQLYVHLAQAPVLPGRQLFGPVHLIVRSDLPVVPLAASLRREVLALDKNQPVSTGSALSDLIHQSLARRRMSTILLGIFAGLALILAAVGLYGLTAYSVTQRRREIGIRIAMGARSRDVLGLVIGQGARLAIAGVGIGLVVSLVLTRVLSSLLFGVTATDPIVFLSVSLFLVAVSLLACYLPARRATRVDPVVVLRCE
jgi:putative ABC transport system permease protein